MSTITGALDSVHIASPCSAAWDAMEGTEQVRFCRQCQLNVYNLSGMSRAEAEALVREREGRLCVRFFRRADGTMLTDDCPVGLRAVRAAARVARWVLGAVAALLVALPSAAVVTSNEEQGIFRDSALRNIEPFATFLEWIDPTPVSPSVSGPVYMGAICPPDRAPAREGSEPP